MSIRFLLVIAGLITATTTMHAQSGVKGQVLDATDGTPVAFANVLLLKQDSSLIAGTNSDAEGGFAFKN
ncbi:MAG: carboxypeptidase-like regulatory domain-containing protein, partial [Tannerellaceae bacterium]|nr:carboxypeptidase-like regulatory domain-containing protein [Tannerellaceae bacterium]